MSCMNVGLANTGHSEESSLDVSFLHVLCQTQKNGPCLPFDSFLIIFHVHEMYIEILVHVDHAIGFYVVVKYITNAK